MESSHIVCQIESILLGMTYGFLLDDYSSHGNVTGNGRRREIWCFNIHISLLQLIVIFEEENMASSFNCYYKSNIFQLYVGLNDMYCIMHNIFSFNIFLGLKFIFLICTHLSKKISN